MHVQLCTFQMKMEVTYLIFVSHGSYSWLLEFGKLQSSLYWRNWFCYSVYRSGQPWAKLNLILQYDLFTKSRPYWRSTLLLFHIWLEHFPSELRQCSEQSWSGVWIRCSLAQWYLRRALIHMYLCLRPRSRIMCWLTSDFSWPYCRHSAARDAGCQTAETHPVCGASS